MRPDAREKHERIVDAAETLFRDKGLGVPLGEIAQRAGVSETTLYRHFPTKAALIDEAWRQRDGDSAS